MLKHTKLLSVWITRCYSMQVDKAALSKLRKKTGIAFINCKKALQKFNNNVEEAEKWLQEEAKKEGWAKATKLQDRKMSQGLIGLVYDKSHVTMIEVNCETDFVARTDKFKNFVANLSSVCHQHGQDLGSQKSILYKDDAVKLKNGNEGTVADLVAMEIGNIGENMQLRRALFYKASEDAPLGSYVYGPAGKPHCMKNCQLGKYGAVVQYTQFQNGRKVTPGNVIGQQIGQHIVGMNPKSIGNMEDIAKEKEMELKEQDKSNNSAASEVVEKSEDDLSDDEEMPVSKPPEKEETRLIFQELLMDPDTKVHELLTESNVEIKDFVRFELGEEIAGESEDGEGS